MKRYLGLTLGLITVILTVLRPQVAMLGAKQATYLFAFTLLPALLPATLGASFILSSNSIFKKKSIFGVWGLGILCGCPGGSMAVISLAERKSSRLMATALVSSSLGPGFILGAMPAMVGVSSSGTMFFVLQNVAALLGACCMGIAGKKPANFAHANSTSTSLAEAPKQAAFAMAIAGVFCICIASVYAASESLGLLTPPLFIMRKTLSILHLSPKLADGLLYGFFEVTGGCARLGLADIPLIQKMAAMSAVAAFGGLPVFFQQFYFLRKAGLSLGSFFIGKLLISLFAFVLSILFAPMLMGEVPYPFQPQSLLLALPLLFGFGLWFLTKAKGQTLQKPSLKDAKSRNVLFENR